MGKTIAQKKWRLCSQTWHKDYATAVGQYRQNLFSVGNLTCHRTTKILKSLKVCLPATGECFADGLRDGH